MESTSLYSPLYCVSGFKVTSGNWTGVKLKNVLEKAGVKEEATKVAFRAEDGFTTDLKAETALKDENILIGYKKDNNPLPQDIRLIVPGRWGYKWIKYLEHIELVDYDFKGTYESKGYSDNAIIEETP